jgi:hypothetical protein
MLTRPQCSVKWSDNLMCRPNAGEQYLDDCPGNKDGCFDMLESTSWGRRVSLEKSLKWVLCSPSVLVWQEAGLSRK